jgi:DNA-directed RNA polymerase subunit RPC12/RpoP
MGFLRKLESAGMLNSEHGWGLGDFVAHKYMVIGYCCAKIGRKFCRTEVKNLKLTDCPKCGHALVFRKRIDNLNIYSFNELNKPRKSHWRK